MAIVESPRPGPSWNTVSSDGHLTSAGMDKFWRRSREELLIDMEGLSYVGRLKPIQFGEEEEEATRDLRSE